MTKTIERPKVEKAIAPAKRWRNRYRLISSVAGVVDTHWIYPSKEIAETKAHLVLAALRAKWGFDFAEYVGAFPVEG